MNEIRSGTISNESERQLALNDILIESSFLSNMTISHTYNHIFNKMLSSVEWHPKHNTVMIGSRGGDVSAVNILSKTVFLCSRGKGRGFQITDIKFDRFDNNWFYTSSTSGKLIKQRIDAKEEIILRDSNDLGLRDLYSSV